MKADGNSISGETVPIQGTAPTSAAWLKRADWVRGEALSVSKKPHYYWIIAIVWSVIACVPLISAFQGSYGAIDHGLRLIILFFPLVGSVLVALASYRTVESRKFGQSTFKMKSVPGAIGGTLEGTIQLRTRIEPLDSFRIGLRCVHRVRTTDSEESGMSEQLLWEDDKLINKQLPTVNSGSSIPVYFQIPLDCLETDRRDKNNQVIWRLRGRAKLEGIDYDAQFEVPVFKTTQSKRDIANRLTPDGLISRLFSRIYKAKW